MRGEDKPAMREIFNAVNWQIGGATYWGDKELRLGVRRRNLMQVSRPTYIAIVNELKNLPDLR